MQRHTIDATHDHSTVFIYDADFGPICSPSHVPHNTLVPVSSKADQVFAQMHIYTYTSANPQVLPLFAQIPTAKGVK